MRELMQGLRDAAMKAIFEAQDAERLEELRIKYLGQKGEMTAILRQMGKLSPEERPVMGQLVRRHGGGGRSPPRGALWRGEDRF